MSFHTNAIPSIAKFAFVAIVIGTLLALTWTAIRWGHVSLILNSADDEMQGWKTTQRATGQYPAFATWQKTYADLQTAQLLEHSSPIVLETLGLLHLQHVNSNDNLQTSQTDALHYFQRAAVARPVSAYTWSNIMLTQYQLGQVDTALYQAMQYAIRLGPWEPEVQLAVTNIGLALWNEMPIALRPQVKQIAERGTKRHAMEILQIAVNRGRLDIVCSFEKLAGEMPCQQIRS